MKPEELLKNPNPPRRPAPPRPQLFKPYLGAVVNLAGQVWRIVHIKSRGRWKAEFSGQDPKFKPEVGMGLDFREPGPILQIIYQAKRRRFWAKPGQDRRKGAKSKK